MAKAYSNDLRRKLLEAYDRGEGSLPELAERFGVSTPWAWKISSQRRRTGQIERVEQRHGPRSRVTAEVAARLRSLLREQPDRTPELLELHEGLMDAVKEWEETDGGAEAFYSDGESVREKDVKWAANFRTEASYRKFVPHITLGFGPMPARTEPFDFIANSVGLFHLGRFCTCRIAFHQWQLLAHP